ncbi:hypothetical protein Hanom_Chr16g01443021 [Helianthus anomalus]
MIIDVGAGGCAVVLSVVGIKLMIASREDNHFSGEFVAVDGGVE